jgi:hypothetical protein
MQKKLSSEKAVVEQTSLLLNETIRVIKELNYYQLGVILDIALEFNKIKKEKQCQRKNVQ